MTAAGAVRAELEPVEPIRKPGPAPGTAAEAITARGSVYCRVLACDFDGTVADDGRLGPEIVTALADARARGIAVVLVTGRVLEDLRLAGVDLHGFDAVVAENGAVVCLPERGRSIQLGTAPPAGFFEALRTRGIPFRAGAVVVGLSEGHTRDVVELVRASGLDVQMVFNRAALMLLPSGIGKAGGVRRALEELRRSERNMIAFGDAENDLSLLGAAQVGVAARGALPAVAAAADERISHPGGAGVAQYVRRLLERGGIAEAPERADVVLGHEEDGSALCLPGSGMTVMITGDPRAGKSWLAGLFAERLLDAGYSVCVVDPEGDHVALGQRPRTLVLGHAIPLPPARALPSVLGDPGLSVVLNLATLPHRAKLAYADEALCALQAVRGETGMPHWIVVDEAHYFFHEASACVCARRFDGRAGGFVFVTYRPSLVASLVHDGVGAYLVAPTAIEEERYFMTALLGARGPRGMVPHDALARLGRERVGLLRIHGAERPWREFTPAERLSVHTHHGRKYADARLPEEKGFRFVGRSGQVTATAHNLVEFCDAVRSVDMDSVRRHLLHADFSRWIADVLGDADLAAGLQKLERTTQAGAPPSRDEIVAHVRDRYFL